MSLRIAVVGLLLAAVASAAVVATQRDRLRMLKRDAVLQMRLLGAGIRVERDILISMTDDVQLAADLYRPRSATDPLPTILIRLPYGKGIYDEPMWWVRSQVPRGYAVMVQNIRGRFASQGDFTPYAHVIDDGAATLDWIAAQPWSNGRVAMAGCSALGEVQLMQAKSPTPALRGLIAQGAGGAIGTGGASRAYFAFFEGGIPNLAASYGWFSAHGGKTGDQMHGTPADPAEVIGQLPSGTLVSRHRADPTDYEDFLSRFEDTDYWRELGYLMEDDSFAVPSLHVNTWHDIGTRGTFEAASLMRANARTDDARDHQHILVGPGLHCAFDAPFIEGRTGDLAVASDSKLDFNGIYESWLDHWLKDAPLPPLAQYTYFVNRADRWDTADTWPPPGVVTQPWHLDTDRLSRDAPATGQASYSYDPDDPTPSIGGPICCTGRLNLPAGPLDQSANAERADMLTFATPPLDSDVTLVGDIEAQIMLSSDAPDTDLVAIVVDIAPDGTMVTIQQGALRLRYRDGFDAPTPPLTPGEPVSVPVTFPPIAYRVVAGHRIGLHLSSASFPRLERNLNTGHPNYSATTPRVARNTVHFGGAEGSILRLPVQPKH